MPPAASYPQPPGRDPALSAWAAFERVSAAQGASCALICGETRMTYGELTRAAGHVAAGLAGLGVTRGDFVGLVAARGTDAVIGLLAILRQGGIAVPLDPTHAAEQIAFMATDVPMKAALVAAGWEDAATAHLPGSLPRAGIADLRAAGTEAPAPASCSGEDAALVLYTSGTTGRPKGVVLPHRAIVSLALEDRITPVTPDDVVLHGLTIACDGAVYDIFAPLLNGAAMAIVPEPTPGLDDLARVLVRDRVTVAGWYAGIHHLMIEHRPEAFAGLRVTTAGGDVLSPRHARLLLDACPDITLINEYGPTETMTHSLCHVVTRAALDAGPIPIGTPVAGDEAFVLGDDLTPLPPGETGQLAIAGAGVALGYHDRPEQTAAAFIDDPRPGRSGKVYLTGDLARQDGNGLFHFLGRADRQVKLGGRRIELDGVEHVLRAQPGVAEAVVDLAPCGTRLAGFVIPTRDADRATLSQTALAGATRDLPAATLPHVLHLRDAFPLTAAGKIDRKALRAEMAAMPTPGARPVAGTRGRIEAVWDGLLGCGPLADDATFFEAGGTSLQLIEAHAQIEAALGLTFPITTLFEVPALGDLARKLDAMQDRDANEAPAATRPADTAHAAIAIVGMAARLPGIASLTEFWEVIRDGRNLIPHFAPEDLEVPAPAPRADATFVPARPVLDGVEMFDARHFGMLAREAEVTDPQQRVLLEICLEALEEAGLDPARFAGRVGVYAGATTSTYLLHNLMPDRAALDGFTGDYQIGNYQLMTGNDADSLATRVAYKLDLTGPAISVNTACSTSLTAIAQAVAALRSGQADAALAGGVSITFPQRRGYLAQDGGMASPDGICRPFDADAGGTVFGHGAGVVLLRRLDDALTDGDHIHAVIRGVGLNNDGAAKMSYTAPSVAGQADAIRSAQADAGVDPATIGYVECHGTATPLGDPVELAGLADAFGPAPRGACAVGSVKGNIGHLDAAAGVVSVIKAALALSHATIPPVANFRAPTPRFDFAASPFKVPTRAEPWQADGPRRAGVSSFGVGGTNAHAVLEEAPATARQAPPDSLQILPLSATAPEALEAMAARLADALDAADAPPLCDAALTLQDGRRALPHRIAVTARSGPEAAAALRSPDKRARKAAGSPPPVLFLFPGQGSQYPGMGSGLYRSEPLYAHCIDAGADHLRPLIGHDIRDLLLAEGAGPDSAAELRDTRLTQPALFLTQVALARVWAARGITPAAMIGHSVGEFSAAAVAGVMSFETALTLIARRGQLMQDQPGGAMLSVRCETETLRPLLQADTDLAAMNAPQLQVVSGPHDAVEGLEAHLAEQGIASTRLHTSHAFHSAMMDPVVAALEHEIDARALHAPRIPILSTVTGRWMDDETAQSPGYWAGQARAPVNFRAAVTAACETGSEVLLEVGAGGTLSAFATQTLARGGHGGVFQSLPDHTRSAFDESAMAVAFANLWCAGVPVDWARSGPRGSRKVTLPGYAFQRQRHWVEAPPRGAAPPATAELPAAQATPTGTEQMPTDPIARLDRLTPELLALFSDLSGEDLTPEDASAPFLELGFDSLFMGQVTQRLAREYGVEMTFRSLLADHPSIAALAAHLDAVLPPDAIPAPVADPAPTVTGQPMAPAAALPAAALPASAPAPASGDVAALIQQQMATMQAVFAEQLRALGQQPAAPSAAPAAPAAATAPAPATEDPAKPEGFRVGRGASVAGADFTPDQRKIVEDLARRYSAKHPGSKAYADRHRATLADPRTAAGFRQDWKELVFPVVADTARGAHITDLDGNRFVDLVNGFGQTAFGHSPDFVIAAVARQMEKGFPIGPQSDLAGPVAEKFAAFVGHERVTFCNTGSEAVMAAMRVARTVTGREKVVVFSQDYHGQFDEVLVKGKMRGSDGAALPIAPGIPRSGLANMAVLSYGSDASLDWIAAHMDEIAAVIVEPVQSRNPQHRPEGFVRKLRDITAQGGAALVIDEVVTGFRTHKRGMQGVWTLQGDMATYGKVVGGGMPIGVLAGDARWMDALDGGAWRFGDDSRPEAVPTFFAGTFVRHPLVLAAVDATLDHMEASGAALWDAAADRCADLAGRMNAAMAARGMPELVEQYSSWFVMNMTETDPRAALLYPLMRMEGVHVMDGFCGFLTTEHGAAECAEVLRAFEAGLDVLAGMGILTGEMAAPSPLSPEKATDNTTDAIPTRNIRLTESQKEIWMTHQLGDAAAASFNESVSIRLHGALDSGALTRALNGVIARHDALRAVFARNGETFDVAPPEPVDLPVTDLSDTPDPEAALADEIARDAALPIALTEGAPLRLSLYKIAENSHVLRITAHHIVCDGWSFGTVFDDLVALYEGKTLAPAPSFAAHAAASANAGPSPETLAYWRDVYADLPDLPDLPTDRPRPGLKSYNGATVTHHIDAARIKAARKAGAAQGCTLFSTLLAALQIVLGRLSGADDVVIGVPTGGQGLLEDQTLVGHCVNFLPIRARFDPASPTADHLKAAGKTALDAFDHADVTFGTLLNALDVPRKLDRLPLTEVEFNLERHSEDVIMGGITARVITNPKAAVNFDLFINASERRDGVLLDLHFNRDLFDAATIVRWARHFETVLDEIARDASRPVASLPLMTAPEEAALAGLGNDTARDHGGAASLPALVAQGAAVRPEAEAVRDDQGALSHAALDARADALAAAIQAAVPVPGARIAVALPRGTDMLVALLAVLKAGHAYVPLDPRQPPARLHSILEQARVSALIADAPPAFAEGLDLAHIRPADAIIGSAPAPVPQDPEAAAYVIFTSGSTGAPKGVEIPHRAVVNFLLSMAESPGFSAEDTLLAVTTVMFDISVLELFLPLVTGGRVVIASTEDVIDGFALARRLAGGDITVMQATPTLWGMLLEAGLTPPPGLKMLAGGEPLPRDLADRLTATGAALWNMYGPTETTVWSALSRVRADAPIGIGTPVANTELHVLGPQDTLLPVGAVGELNIGGDGLATGYFGREDLTAAAFRDVTLAGRPRRLYRTGDLARRNADGAITLLGRKDTQVKLRGFRIELGDIEEKLRGLDGIAAAAVDLRANPAGDRRLVAYVVPAAGATPETGALRQSLAALLPDYMVPAAFVVLSALPQTGNGKLDRRALPDPDDTATVTPLRPAAAPEGATEQKIAAIWADVLGRDGVGVTDTLYDLGADSLTVFRIAARMLDDGLNLEARHLLAHPTIRELAAFADTRSDGDAPARPSLKAYRHGARRGTGAAS